MLKLLDMRSESLKRAQQKYAREKKKTFSICLQRDTDADIIELLEKQENRNGFLRKLLRNYLDKNN